MRPKKPAAGQPDADGRRSAQGRATGLQSANLGSPVFKERWDRGSPLDWTDFVTRCRSLHDPRAD